MSLDSFSTKSTMMEAYKRHNGSPKREIIYHREVEGFTVNMSFRTGF